MSEQVLGIGSQIWFFDENRRRYAGGISSRPIWREHWRPMWIVGENRVSWLLSYTKPDSKRDTILCGKKVPKKRGFLARKQWAFSVSEIDDLEWDSQHRYEIMERARRDATVDQLRTIAKMINYKPETDK